MNNMLLLLFLSFIYGLSVMVLFFAKIPFFMKKSKDKKKSINWSFLLPFAIMPTFIILYLFVATYNAIYTEDLPQM